MALVRTTLTAACSATDKQSVVASATSIAAGRLIRIDGEEMAVSKEWVSGTTIPVLRALDGTAQVAHVASAGVVHGPVSDFDDAPPQVSVGYPSQRPVLIQSITTTPSTLTLPPAGCDLRLILNGTAAITLTIPVPTLDMEGALLTIVSNGAAAHLLTFTGGLSGAGSSNDVITVNATARPPSRSSPATTCGWRFAGRRRGSSCGRCVTGNAQRIELSAPRWGRYRARFHHAGETLKRESTVSVIDSSSSARSYGREGIS